MFIRRQWMYLQSHVQEKALIDLHGEMEKSQSLGR